MCNQTDTVTDTVKMETHRLTDIHPHRLTDTRPPAHPPTPTPPHIHPHTQYKQEYLHCDYQFL